MVVPIPHPSSTATWLQMHKVSAYTLSPPGSPLWCQPGLGAMRAIDIEWIVGNAFWRTGGRPVVSMLHPTPGVASLDYPGATSFVRSMVHFSAAWQIKPALFGFASRARPPPPCSSLYILPLLLTQVFWLRIPRCLHQTKLPLEETKFFSFSGTMGECGLFPDSWRQSHTSLSSLFTQALWLACRHICSPWVSQASQCPRQSK